MRHNLHLLVKSRRQWHADRIIRRRRRSPTNLGTKPLTASREKFVRLFTKWHIMAADARQFFTHNKHPIYMQMSRCHKAIPK